MTGLVEERRRTCRFGGKIDGGADPQRNSGPKQNRGNAIDKVAGIQGTTGENRLVAIDKV